MLQSPIKFCNDPEAVAFDSENSRAFLSCWQAQRENGRVPRAEAMNPTVLRTLLPEIIIYELPDVSTVRYRLVGTLAARRLGFEPKGMNLARFALPEMRPIVTLGFNLVARSHVGVLAHFRLVFGGEVTARIEMLLLPLMAPPGKAPRVIGLTTRETLPPELTRYGVDRPIESIEDASIIDLGFGLPDLSMIPGLAA